MHQISSFPLVQIIFFFNDTATTEIYTLSLHDALPILGVLRIAEDLRRAAELHDAAAQHHRSEEHTSELQSLAYLVCRLLLEKNNTLFLTRAPNNLSTLTFHRLSAPGRA